MADRIEAVVEELAQPILTEMGLELVDVEWVREGGRRFLRLYIDKPGGVTLDDCEAASRRVEARLDQVDPIAEPYYLEVSSPGVDRPLKRDADFIRFAGRTVRIRTYGPVAGRREFVGELLGLDGDQVRLRLPGEEAEMAIPRAQIARANLHTRL